MDKKFIPARRKIISSIVELPFDKMKIENSEVSNAVKVTLKFGQDTLMITMPIDSESEVVYSYFDKDGLVVSNQAQIDEVVNGFIKFFN